MLRALLATAFLALLGTVTVAEDIPESAVGMPARVRELVLPGSELDVVKLDARSPLVLRRVAVYPHGTDHRYTFEYYGLEAGEFDLRDFLRRVDGSSMDGLPPIPVSVRSVLPADQTRPHVLQEGRVPFVGGYFWIQVLAGVLWLTGLLAILFLGRKQKSAAAHDEIERCPTLADRLRPLVEAAVTGELSRERAAELELALVAFWRRRLQLDDINPNEALKVLHNHPEAGALLRALEDWLHRPEPTEDVNVEALLQPYRDLPPEEEEAAGVLSLTGS